MPQNALTGQTIVAAPSPIAKARNPGMALDLDWIQSVRVNKSAGERRAATLGKRRSIKKDWQAAWLVKAVSCIDLTTLAGDDTPGRVARLCAKARRPVRADVLRALGLDPATLTTGAVCVYHEMIETAVAALDGSAIAVAAVSTGFPAGQTPFGLKIMEIEQSVAAADSPGVNPQGGVMAFARRNASHFCTEEAA